MLDRPQFKSIYRVESLGDHGAVLLSERDQVLLRGTLMARLATQVDGSTTSDDLVSRLAEEFPVVDLYYALAVLERDGYLVEANGAVPRDVAAFWEAQDLDPHDATARLSATRVAVTALGGVDEGAVRDALSAGGLASAAHGDDADLLVVATDEYDRPELAEVNRAALEGGRPWFVFKPVGTQAWLGPLFVPRQGPCWECLVQRLRANRQMESFVAERRPDRAVPVTSVASFAAGVSAATHLAALEAAKAATGRSHLTDALVTVDLLTLEHRRHRLVHRPQCRACGDPALRDPARPVPPVVLGRAAKRHRTGGGHRAVTPEETLAAFEHHVSPLTGVVTKLERLDPGETSGLVYTYAAGHNFALMNRDELFFLLKNLRGRSGGKGVSDVQARVSGLCEAIERYSGVWRDDEPRRHGTYASVPGAVHPSTYLLFSDRQYEERKEWNRAQESNFHLVPERFDDDRSIDWSPAWSLTDDEHRYVPSAYCWFGHPDIMERYDTPCDANGCAAGNTLEEAILQGFLELVERDAVALWWYNRLRRPAVDLQSFGDPYVSELQEHYFSTLCRELWAIDLTTDLGIPVIAAVSRRTDKPVEDVVVGFGAHLDPRVALLRALTEVNQFMPTVGARGADGETAYWYDDPEAIRWWKTATVRNQPYVVPDPDAPARRLADFRRLDGEDIAADVETCVGIATAHGMETLVVDQTRPDIGLPVAKVIVPGLRHFWRRLGPGRLYEAPVRLGWLDAPTPEEDMNPIGVFF